MANQTTVKVFESLLSIDLDTYPEIKNDITWFAKNPKRKLRLRCEVPKERKLFRRADKKQSLDAESEGVPFPFVVVMREQESISMYSTMFMPGIHQALNKVWRRYGNGEEPRIHQAIMEGMKNDLDSFARGRVLYIKF